MSVAPMKYTERTALGQHLKDEDHDLLIDMYRGFTPSGTFISPYSYLISKTTDGGIDYYCASNAYQPIYGGSTLADHHNGGVDGANAAAVIQAAIDGAYATNGGGIFFRNAVYNCTALLHGHNNVCLYGETRGSFDDFTDGAVLQYSGAAVGVFLDFEDCRYFSIENLKAYNTGAATVGLRIGGAHNDAAKSKATHVRNIVIDSFPTGILGSAVGPDNLSYYDVFIGNCTTCCIDHHGSLLFYGGALYASPTAIGVRCYRTPLGSFPDAGAWFWGTTWSTIGIAIDLAGNDCLRTMTFDSCWFEVVKTTILNTQNADAGIYLGYVVFDNCVGYTDVGATSFMDLRGRSINVEWRGGEIWPQDNPEPILTDGAGATVQRVSISGTPAGIDRISWTDLNSGLRGYHQAVFPIFLGGAAVTTATAVGWATSDPFYETHFPWRAYTTTPVAHFYVDWNPGSASGGVRIFLDGGIGEIPGSKIEPGVNGHRQDDVAVVFPVTVGWDNHFKVQFHGDGATAPTIYQMYVIYEW
jgi:hypothetical protein